jgi:hypothetical protein
MILALERFRQQAHEFEVSLCYAARPCLKKIKQNNQKQSRTMKCLPFIHGTIHCSGIYFGINIAPSTVLLSISFMMYVPSSFFL